MRYLAWPNNLLALSATTWVADNASTAHPVSNLSEEFVSQAWRTTGASDVNLYIDLGAAKSINLLALSGLTMGTTGTLTWTGGASQNATNINQVLTYREFDMYNRLTAAQSWRFHRVRIQDPGNPDGYLQVGMVWLGTASDTPIQFTPDWTEQPNVRNREQLSDVGVLHSELLARQTEIGVLFSGLSKTQADTIWDEIVVECNGSELPVFIIPKDEEYEGYTMKVTQPTRSRTRQMIEIGIKFIEAIRGIATNG